MITASHSGAALGQEQTLVLADSAIDPTTTNLDATFTFLSIRSAVAWGLVALSQTEVVVPALTFTLGAISAWFAAIGERNNAGRRTKHANTLNRTSSCVAVFYIYRGKEFGSHAFYASLHPVLIRRAATCKRYQERCRSKLE